RQVEAPVALAVYGLENDADTLREWYSRLHEASRLPLLIRSEAVDLLWAVALAATLIALVHLVAQLGATRRPRLAAAMRRWAPLIALGPVFDLVENAFSLAMLTDPAGFPDWWALAHGAAARAKFALSGIGAVVGIALTTIIVWPARRMDRSAARSDHGTDAQQAVSPRPPPR
uniref:hypothetical protein n=1 Tax=Pseudactinotalea sp. TaxID=1926260 RepID=UPI003B3AE900